MTLGLQLIASLKVLKMMFDLAKESLNNIDNPIGFDNVFVPREDILYDYIIVGGGTTGCVIANRLSEDPNVKVLVLEAGHDGTLLTNIFFGSTLLFNSPSDWKYESEPEPTSCLGFVNGRCHHNRGKMLGGSSNLNALVFVRGNSKDFDYWESLGNPGWGFRDVLHYFKKSEGVRIPGVENNPFYRNQFGPVSVSYPNFQSPLLETWVEAGRQLGYNVYDYNGANQTGFFKSQVSMREGRRVSSAAAYMKPARHRNNLFVGLNSLVTKIHFNGNRAIGVTFKKRGVLYTVRAKEEVILSAGTFASAQILMLSGIGPASHLIKMGIPVVQDLPVGANMESHVAVGGISYTVDTPVSVLVIPTFVDPQSYWDVFQQNQTGPLTAAPVEGVAFINTDDSEDPEWPDIELELETLNPLTADGGIGFPIITNLKRSVLNAFKPLFARHSIHITMYINRPKSRGRVFLRDTNPESKPLIYRNWFSHPFDIKRTIAGIKTTLRVMEAPAWQKYGVKFFPAILPGCEHHVPFSDQYWECHIRTFSWTQWHETSTCRMGPSREDSVVQPNLIVHGMENLRVADASIFPSMTSGNLQAVCYMIGEKAADLIKLRNRGAVDFGNFIQFNK